MLSTKDYKQIVFNDKHEYDSIDLIDAPEDRMVFYADQRSQGMSYPTLASYHLLRLGEYLLDNDYEDSYELVDLSLVTFGERRIVVGRETKEEAMSILKEYGASEVLVFIREIFEVKDDIVPVEITLKDSSSNVFSFQRRGLVFSANGEYADILRAFYRACVELKLY